MISTKLAVSIPQYTLKILDSQEFTWLCVCGQSSSSRSHMLVFKLKLAYELHFCHVLTFDHHYQYLHLSYIIISAALVTVKSFITLFRSRDSPRY